MLGGGGRPSRPGDGGRCHNDNVRIAYVTAGAGGTLCGNCLKDNTLARALISLGHDVQLIPTYTPIRTDEPDVSLDQVFLGGINVYLQSVFPVFRRTPGWLDRLWDNPALLRWVSRFAVRTGPEALGALTVSVLEGPSGPQRKEFARLAAWLKQTRPDVVHITNSMLGGVAQIVKQELDLPVFCSLQGEDFFLSNLPAPYGERAFELLRKAAESVDVFVATSRDHARAMAGHLAVAEEQIAVVCPGIDTTDFREPAARDEAAGDGAAGAGAAGDGDQFVIGYLARVSPEKGLDRLLAAFRILRDENPTSRRVRLRIAGWLGDDQRPYFEELRRRAGAWGLGESVEFLGYLERPEKLAFLRSLDVLSVPVSYRAAKGLYVLEAMASGVPVVQPRLGVFPELLEATGGGLLFEPGHENADTENALAAGLRQLLENPEQARHLGLSGRRAVLAHYHSRRMAEETLELYRAATGRPPNN